MNIPKHQAKDWPKRVEDVLRPNHLEDLRKSDLSDETILEGRYYSVLSPESKELLNREGEVGTGYVTPYPTANGFLEDEINFKPDTPLPSIKKGSKGRKYLRPIGSKSRLYIPRRVWPIVNDVSVPISLTEGEKKACKATQDGFPTIAVSGVWNWSSEHAPVEDFDLIKWQGRTVHLVFDGDKFSNKSVLLAEKRLAEALTNKGAKVKIIDLPEGDEQ